MYKVILEKPVEKFLQKHKWEKIIFKFYESVKILSKNPNSLLLDTKNMIGLENIFRLRIWKYRFLYRVEKEEICIYFIDAGARGNIYKK